MAAQSKKMQLRRFGTEITNTADIQTDKRTDAQAKIVLSKVSPDEDVEMDESSPEIESLCGNKRLQVSEMQEIKSKRRKAVLKDLEVCDLLDLRNPQCVAEYATSCFEAMKDEEVNFLIEKDFLEPTQIKEKHRRKLFEWLSDFLKKFKMLPETYFITCKLIDLAVSKLGCE